MAKKDTTKSATQTKSEVETNDGDISPDAALLYEKRQFLAKIKRELQRDIDSRRRYDYEWMVREMYRRGYHFSRYQPNSQTIVLASRQNAKIPINIVAAQMRSIRNQVTSFRPKFEVMPRYGTDTSENQARYAGRYLDYWFDKNKIKTRIKETVIQGLTFSVGGPWEIYYDPESKEVKMYLIDPFDFYVDRFAESFDEAMRCVKAVRTNLGGVRANQDFDKQALGEITSSQSKLAVSEYKQFIIQAMKVLDSGGFDDTENIILYEGYYKLRDKDGKMFIRKVVWTDQNITPLIWEDFKDDTFPFVMYRADLNPKDIYGESWMKHVIPINRVIDMLESSVYDYNNRVAKGRIVVDRDSGVRAIHNVHGEIITKNRGSEVKALELPNLPQAVSLQIDRMGRYLEDVGGAHDASLGRVPTGVKAGIGIAELKQADACVDTKTQALTKDGWKNFDELPDGGEIYVFNPETKKLGWGKLNKVFTYDKNNVDVYEFNTKNISALTTPDHSWMIVNSRNNWSKQETQSLKNDQYIPLIAESESIISEKVFDDDFVRLVGWTITEGSYSKNNGNAITIYQSEDANWDKVQLIKELFERLDIERESYLDNRGCRQFVFASEYAKKIRELFPNKTLTTEFVNQLTKEQLNILIETMILGDGHIRGSGRRSFINTQKETIDSLQLACILLGLSTSIGEYDDGDDNHATKYVLYLKETNKISVGKLIDKGQMSPIKFTGKVWCPNTDTGFWLARRNGKVFITGNTNQDDLVDNLEDFLEQVGLRVLRCAARNLDSYTFIRAMGVREGEEKYFAVIGSKSGRNKNKKQVKIGPDWVDLAVLGEDNNIRVTIGSWLGYTKEMMQEKTINLLKMGAIDQKTFLRLWEFGDIDKIVQETRKEALLNKNLNMQQQGGQGGNPGEEDQYGLAMTENEMMVMESKDMPVDSHDDHVVHIAIHQDALGQGADDLVQKHIERHQVYLGETYGATGTNEPQGQPQPQGAPQEDGQPQGGQPGQPPPGMPTNAALGRLPMPGSPLAAIGQGQPVMTGNPYGT